jgi:hypothetical protein
MTKPRTIDLDKVHSEHETSSPGPSDSSDAGADLIGADSSDVDPESTSDRHGTGEGLNVENELEAPPGADIAPDRIVSAQEAGLGGGLDQAEEAQLGITDEEIAAAARKLLGEDLE